MWACVCEVVNVVYYISPLLLSFYNDLECLILTGGVYGTMVLFLLFLFYLFKGICLCIQYKSKNRMGVSYVIAVPAYQQVHNYRAIQGQSTFVNFLNCWCRLVQQTPLGPQRARPGHLILRWSERYCHFQEFVAQNA